MTIKAGAYIRGEYERELAAAKACESEIVQLRKTIEECERHRDQHYAAATRWAAGTDIEKPDPLAYRMDGTQNWQA